MNPEIQTTQKAEFLLRRTTEAFPDWALGVPILFAFGVLLLITLFRTEKNWKGLLAAFGATALLSVAYFFLAQQFKPVFSWWVVLAPMLAIALVYVVLMYWRDAQTIHPAWAGFLGILRTLVYAILAFVFLLPGCQNWETTETHSKVVFLFDVSGSMNSIDDLPAPNQDPTTLPTRQDKVLGFLTAPVPRPDGQATSFLEGLVQKTPLTAYRFGKVTDDLDVQQLKASEPVDAAAWSAWLKPDKTKVKVSEKLTAEEQAKTRARLNDLIDDLTNGTNLGGSALQAAKLEAGSFLQGIVIVSDGQSNTGGDEALKEFLARVGNPKRPVPVFTVGIGQYRQPVNIRIDNLLTPASVRPDDKFPVRVPVIGEGLPDEEFQVTLEGTRMRKDEDGNLVPIAGEKTYMIGPKPSKFSGGGDQPHALVEFEIDIRALKGIDPKDDSKDDQVEGTWEFKAKIPRNPRETFTRSEHVSELPARVLVQKRKLRVLLFAGGPSREYQFLRTLFYREVLEKRCDLAVYLQTAREEGVDQDVEGEWLLNHFPDKLGPDDPRDKHSSLNEYDVILAIDPDWTALDPQQLTNLKEWVGTHAGGIVFVAGPVHSFHLARPGGLDLSALLTIYPVVLKDSRLHGLGIGHDPSRPYALNFSPGARLVDFLKLDEEDGQPLETWQKFFWEGVKPEPGKENRPKRGFFNYYPVEKIKPASEVLATFAGPAASRINDGRDEQPYLVAMPYGAGKSYFLSSGETWRLIQYRQKYHERFWIKLARTAGSGTLSKLSRHGMILMTQKATTGSVPFEAQILGENLLPLPRDSRPTVLVKRPNHFDPAVDKETPVQIEMKPKSTQGDWNGWFAGSFKVRTPGDYTLKIPIPGTSQVLSHDVTIRLPNLELDNTRPNFGQLYQMASEAGMVLNKLQPEVRKEIERILQVPGGETLPDSAKDGKEGLRLFFPISAAEAIPKCLLTVPPRTESTKGALQDLWDKGWQTGYEIRSYVLALAIPLLVGVLGLAILSYLYWNDIKEVQVGTGFWIQAIAMGLGAVLGLNLAQNVLATEMGDLDASYWWLYYLIEFITAFALALLAGGLVLGVLLLVKKGIIAPFVVALATALAFFGVLLLGNPDWIRMPVDFSFVLIGVVSLLGIEWLTRKLLKLA